jgi:hypothetical protein
MEELDRIGARVTLMGVLGGIGGAASAIMKGHARLSRTAGLSALSCGMAATALLGAERIVDLCISNINASSLQQQQQQQQEDGNSDYLEQFRKQRQRTMLITHAAGGAIGGALLGALYTRRPFQGVVVFIPIMMCVGLGESMFQDMKDEEYTRRRKMHPDIQSNHSPYSLDEPNAHRRDEQQSQ